MLAALSVRGFGRLGCVGINKGGAGLVFWSPVPSVSGVVLEVGEGDVEVGQEVGGVDELADGGGPCVGPVWGLLCCVEADVRGDLCCAGGCEVAGGGVPVGVGGVDPELGV